ncbi:MAG: glucoamylase family protein [Candidatus Eiseniibacteriota bacterium]
MDRAQARTLPVATVLFLFGSALALASCTSGERAPARASSSSAKASGSTEPYGPTPRQIAFIDTLEERTFRFFWEQTDSATGLSPDRWPTRSFVSVGAVGFALTAYPIGAERGYVSRAAARDRALATVRFFLAAPQGTAKSGVAGYRGFFYHFVDPKTGLRFEQVELSTVDTALLLGGVLFCQSYFDRDDPAERELRALADSLYARVDFRWAQKRPPLISHGWTPEEDHLPWDWVGYSEAMLLVILALGSPTYAVEPAAWEAWLKGYTWGTYYGQEHVGFPPLFGHQYSHMWIDFRGIRDRYMREKGIDYFENARRATLAQRAYAIENPSGFAGYGERLWGLTACDGPTSGEVTIRGRKRTFDTYSARGASYMHVNDDGTIAPTAAGGSIAFAPEIVIPTLVAMREDWGPPLFTEYGFVDAMNPTLDVAMKTQHGKVVPGVGWFDTDYLGIDQGPILGMIENWRTGLVWRTMRKNPHIVRGLERAGFTGGWLDSVRTTR